MATGFLVVIYLAFISLGLPDPMLGAAWPLMQVDFGAPLEAAGAVSMVISGGTILSSLLSGRLIARFGNGRLTLFSVILTAAALVGFALAPSFGWLVVLAVPYGLGGGAVDAALNNYVAAHYESRHMSWLHAFWGVGTMIGPMALSALIAGGLSWRSGYWAVAGFQTMLVLILIFTLPLWGKVAKLNPNKFTGEADEAQGSRVTIPQAIKIPGVKLAMLAFLFYCGVETTVMLWGASYLIQMRGIDAATAAQGSAAFFAGITAGRILSGFLTMKLSNKRLIWLGVAGIIVGVALLLIPGGAGLAMAGFFMLGLGCAPIFPCMLHETPVRFGIAASQTVMGMQTATAYTGSTLLPPLLGVIASCVSLQIFPFVLLGYALALGVCTACINRNLARKGAGA